MAFRVGPYSGLTAAVEVREAGAVRQLPADAFALQVEPVPYGAVLRLTVTNRGRAPIVLHRLYPLIGGPVPLGGGGQQPGQSGGQLPVGGGGQQPGQGGGWPPVGGSLRVYKQGWQSWSYAGALPIGGADIHPRFFLTRAAHADPTWRAPRRRGVFQSEGMLMVGPGAAGARAGAVGLAGGSHVLLCGFTSGARLLGRFQLSRDRLEAWCEGDGVALYPGETFAAEPLLVLFGPEQAVLEGYTDAVTAAMQPRVPARSPTVWCSWYYHFTGVTEQHMLDAVAGLRRADLPVDVVQLDDGYQTAVGDWLSTNPKFPHGLPWLAEQIRLAGYTPGLWLAPFIAQRRSRLYREHPDWFVEGGPSAGFNPSWSDVTYGLDTTHPGAQEWLSDLVRTLVGAGFRYLKLDFLYGAAVAGRRHDRRATRASALRTGLEVIRRAAGDDVFLLGCGSPLLPAVGLVDGMRVGPDVAPSWKFRFAGLPVLGREPGTASAHNALRMALGRQWMHGRFWANDPDSLILRDTQTRLTPEEARSLVSVAGLSGGVISFSDPPGLLSPERLGWLRRVLPPAAVGVQPVSLLGDLFLSTARRGDWQLLLAFNEGKRARPIPLPEGNWHVYDCWEERYLGALQGTCGSAAPHGCRVLALRPAGPVAPAGPAGPAAPADLDGTPAPVVVGASFHLSPLEAIASTEWDGATLTITLAPGVRGDGTITVAEPAGEVVVPGVVIRERRSGPLGEWIITVTAP